MISTLSVQVIALVACGALFVFMIFIAIWTPRAFSKSRVFSSYMRQAAGKRLVACLIVALEVVLLSDIIHIAQNGIWPDNNAPLVLPCMTSALQLAGLGGMFWASYRLYRLQKSR
jgi:hypothetical protein